MEPKYGLSKRNAHAIADNLHMIARSIDIALGAKAGDPVSVDQFNALTLGGMVTPEVAISNMAKYARQYAHFIENDEWPPLDYGK